VFADIDVESDESDEDDAERPMTIDELKRRSVEASSAKKLSTSGISASSKRKNVQSRS